jgi:DNA repair exonuclease SbcCD ATPase subunit
LASDEKTESFASPRKETMTDTIQQRVSEYRTQTTELRPLFSMVRSRAASERAQVARMRARIRQIEEDKTLLLKAVAVIDGAIRVVSANGIGVIESLVTTGLRLVFGDESMAFWIVKRENVRGNSYELEGQKGEVRGPIMDTFGGGMANVVAFLLRVILINRFNLARCLVVDESFNNVSAEFLPMVSEMLKQLTIARDFTIFAVSHQPAIAAAADRVYRAVPNAGAPPTLHPLTSAELQRLVARAEETL